MLGNFDDYNNHIHLVLKNKYGNYINNNDHNTIVYFIKKYESHLNKFYLENSDKVKVLTSNFAYPEDFSMYCKFSPKIVHSKEFKISIDVKPSKIVHDMIDNFKNFSS